MDPLSLSLDGLARKCAPRPRDWPKGAPSPLNGPGGMAAATADCPSNRRVTLSCVGCAHWPTDGNLARSPRIGRERCEVLLNSAHRERYGVRIERRCCCSCW